MAQLMLETTASAGLRPLGAPGQRSFELITATVLKALSPAHAALFAEPVASPKGDATDWYAPVTGTAKRLTDLEPEAQETLRARLTELAADIFALADRLSGAHDPDSQRLAQALRNALEAPDERAIFAVGDQPVLITWAHQLDVQQAPQGLLQGMVSLRAAPASAPAPQIVTSSATAAAPVVSAADVAPLARVPLDWLWWLTVGAAGLVLAAVLWLLIAPCGLRGPDWMNACPAPTMESVINPELGARRAQLEAEIASLERAALAADRACRPVSAPAPSRAEAPPPTPSVDEIDERRRQAGGQSGELTITLIWDSTVDLDMHLSCPGGETISYRRRKACGGELDLDANVRARSSSPVENIYFRTGAPQGVYRIRVNMYDSGTQRTNSQKFTVRVQIGDTRQTFDGVVSTRRRDWTHSFEFRG